METNYRFWIYARRFGSKLRYQLRVGMSEDRDMECVPAYRTAFAQRLPLHESHVTEAEAQLELSALLEVLGAHWRARNLQAA